MGIVLIGAYVTVISVIIAVLTEDFVIYLEELWLWMVEEFNIGNWILWIGIWVYIVVAFFFFMFVLWNHGVYVVLRQIKKIEEEEQIDRKIKEEEVRKMDTEGQQKEYERQTGKDAIYRGEETKGYKSWKKKMNL